jgi:catechol 2,3-dioxygenase-like lactoylglutathione lyase family enzyme
LRPTHFTAKQTGEVVMSSTPRVTGVNHLAFITEDMERTIRFYRDLLGMELVAGIGHDGYRHYFFKFGDAQVAFFEYDGARPMEYKFHGVMTNKPLGFDHVSLTVDSKEDLFAFKDRLEAAGIEVTGAIDHGTIWSIYFFDPNVIPLEISWECMELLATPAMSEDDPLDIVAEGAGPQSGVWPEVTTPTPPEKMVASPGNGLPMRDKFLKDGKARLKEGFPEAAE